jgi:hypothetical protein
MRFINTILVFIGIFGLGLVIYILTREYYTKNNKPIIIEKPIVKDIKKVENIENSQKLKNLFGNMFQNPSPWFGSFNIYNENFRSLTDMKIVGK